MAPTEPGAPHNPQPPQPAPGHYPGPPPLQAIGPDWSLQGRRVRLRPLAESDLKARLAMTNDPAVQRETLGITVGERTPYDIRSWFASLSRDPTSRQLAIEDEAGRYIGDIDLHSYNPAQREAWVEPLLGDPAVRARGLDEVAAYLRDAVGTLAGWLFTHLGLQRLMAEVLSTNPTGLQALTGLGFRQAGQIDHLNGVLSHILELTPDRLATPAEPPGTAAPSP